MMEKIEKLVVALTALAVEATEYLERKNNPEKMIQGKLALGGVTEPAPGATLAEVRAEMDMAAEANRQMAEAREAAVAAEAPKKRKARVPKTEAPEETGVSGIEVPATPPAPVEPTEDEQKASFDTRMDVTKTWVMLAKNDTPKDGKTVAMEALKVMGKAKLGDLSHQERLGWIAMVDGWITEHK